MTGAELLDVVAKLDMTCILLTVIEMVITMFMYFTGMIESLKENYPKLCVGIGIMFNILPVVGILSVIATLILPIWMG